MCVEEREYEHGVGFTINRDSSIFIIYLFLESITETISIFCAYLLDFDIVSIDARAGIRRTPISCDETYDVCLHFNISQ